MVMKIVETKFYFVCMCIQNILRKNNNNVMSALTQPSQRKRDSASLPAFTSNYQSTSDVLLLKISLVQGQSKLNPKRLCPSRLLQLNTVTKSSVRLLHYLARQHDSNIISTQVTTSGYSTCKVPTHANYYRFMFYAVLTENQSPRLLWWQWKMVQTHSQN